jgi:hypothetical protein
MVIQKRQAPAWSPTPGRHVVRVALSDCHLEWVAVPQRGGARAKAGEMAKASARPRRAWEQLPDSSQRIYLALAEGDQQRAQQLYEQDQQPHGRQRRRAARATRAAAAAPPTRDLRGFVDRDGRLVPREMAAAEAWKRRQARQ